MPSRPKPEHGCWDVAAADCEDLGLAPPLHRSETGRDQQIPLERAFAAPYELAQRLGRPLDAAEPADFDPEALGAVFSRQPALHRFPGSMAKRVQALCRIVVDTYDGDAAPFLI